MIGWYDHPEAGRVPAVLDHKSGNPAYQIDGKAAQLGYFAVWLHIMLEAPQVYALAYLTQEPDQPRGHLWTSEELTRQFKTMRDHEKRLQLLEQNVSELPSAAVGKWCKWCPAKPVCPFWTRKAGGDGDS